MAFVGGGNGNGSGSGKRKGKELENNGIIVKRRGDGGTHPTMDEILREEISQKISRFLIVNAIPLNVVKSDEFFKMCEFVSLYGPGFKPPSVDELRQKYLKQQVNKIKDSIEEHRIKWKNSGCSILMDSWNNGSGMTICNFFVNSPKGTIFLKSVDASDICKSVDSIFEMIDEVVNEVGQENVVQVVTKNEENYKAAGEMLMKRKRIFWTPCAVHCIELILEDFEKKLQVHKETIANGQRITTYVYSRASLIALLHYFTKGKDLIRPAVTRCATSYLTLDCLNRNKEALMRMFTSKHWKTSRLSGTTSGKHVENLVIDSKFWKNIVVCLKAANPLIKVLQFVNSDEKPAMGFIYHEMNRAKDKIRNAFRKRYMPLWDIIDEKWEKQHRKLNATAYYLNPQFHYSPDFKSDIEVKCGLYGCLQRMVPNIDEASKIDLQLEDFKQASNFFGNELAKFAIKTKEPAEWWDSYGSEYPELQDFAIRILSLTCSASGCENNWNALETVHSKRRNHLKQQMMNDVMFVMSNSKLGNGTQSRKAFEYSIEDLASDDEWIVENNGSSSNDKESQFYDLDLIVPNEDDIHGDQDAPSDDLEIPDDDTDFYAELVVSDDEDGASIATDDVMESDGDDMKDESYNGFDVNALL